MHYIVEGEARCAVPNENKVCAKMEVFYNPLMKENRDITILFLNAFFAQPFAAASIMAGTGIREVRFFKEVPLMKFLAINDGNPKAAALIAQNLDENEISQNNYTISTMGASLFLLGQKACDYIDIDPFGTPNPFLDAAVKKCKHGGILAITATDTAAFSGTYPKATLRKYWAVPLRIYAMHEIGIRILLRKVQLVAAQYNKAAIPVYCYSSQHYYRVFVQINESRSETDSALKQHGLIKYCPSCSATSFVKKCSCTAALHEAGPLWLGNLWDSSIAETIARNNKWKTLNALLNTISEEAHINTIGFFDVHAFAEKKQSSFLPRMSIILGSLRNAGFSAARTHFSPYGIRTNAPHPVIEKLFNR